VIGHNVAGFDIHYLWVRCVVNGLRTPYWWPTHAKPWDTDRIFDTMAQAAGSKQFMSLSSLCLALGIDSPKGELDGSKIYDFWLAGRFAEIEAYQARDIVATRAVYKRMALITEPV
jgi:predicted PolB exonuclease-like 3'-5' exonuclease